MDRKELMTALHKFVEGKDALAQPSKFVGMRTQELEDLGWITWRDGAWYLTTKGKEMRDDASN